jgi:CelD/BcsL family acetyltransferase involved in cellulose biosynthesis
VNFDVFDGFPDDGTAVAPETGPFPFRAFLETVWKHRVDKHSTLSTFVEGEAAVAFEVTDDMVRFAGQENLTDYHSPVGGDPHQVLVAGLMAMSGRRFRFDSLPREAADAVATSLTSLGTDFTETEHEVTAVLALPASSEDWLMGIGKKERHEVRRKRRKFEAEFGEIDVVRSGDEALDAFIAMHKTSPGDKGEFMTPAMEAFFTDLVVEADAIIHLLVCGGRPLAAAFGFETDAGYFYYNSALESDAAHASPGIVLFSTMIETQIERGATVFDFLKGDERYKFRHGAEPRQLYVLEGTLP